MKKTLVLVAVLLLTSSLAWAEGTPGGAAAPEAVNPADSTAVEGSCTLPDFTGLSLDQRVAAALAAGFQTSEAVNVQAPACPDDVFHCNSITNCAAGTSCTTQNLGECCDLGGGELACCANGSIRVRRCPCVCNGSPCAIQCTTSTDVSVQCR